MENLSFKELNLSEEVQNALAEMGFEEATPIQSKAIPYILEHKDIVGQAQTGTGKTCAFGIPTIEAIDTNIESIQALVLCPTRELAIQIAEELKNVSKYKSRISILPIYGGQSIERQISALKRRPQIIIGTPGRVMDHMRRRTLKLDNLKMMILDEADEMLNMGFREDIDTILESIPKERQTLLFSATIPKEIMDLTAKYQNEPIVVKAAHKQLTVPNIEQFYIETKESAKVDVLSRIIDINNIKLAMIFCNTKKKVDEVTATLQSRGYLVDALHGDMKQMQRDKVMGRFRKREFEILIATDVAARGLDVDDVEAVFNYDIPNDEEYYVHRIGRTGRAGKTGKAYTFVYGREIYKLKDIQRYTRSNIIQIKPPSIVEVEEYRIARTFENIKSVLSQKQHSKYISYIEKFIEEMDVEIEHDNYTTSLDIAASLLKMSIEQDYVSNEDDSYSNDEIIDKKDNMVRLFINAGSKDRIQPRLILEGISSSTSMPGKLVGAIDIFDKYTFIEVPRQYAEEVLTSMKNYKIRGRKINVEKAKKR